MIASLMWSDLMSPHRDLLICAVDRDRASLSPRAINDASHGANLANVLAGCWVVRVVMVDNYHSHVFFYLSHDFLQGCFVGVTDWPHS